MDSNLNPKKINAMKVLSLTFTNEADFSKAAQMLDAKNADSFLLNISLQVANEVVSEEICFRLDLENIEYSASIY